MTLFSRSTKSKTSKTDTMISVRQQYSRVIYFPRLREWHNYFILNKLYILYMCWKFGRHQSHRPLQNKELCLFGMMTTKKQSNTNMANIHWQNTATLKNCFQHNSQQITEESSERQYGNDQWWVAVVVSNRSKVTIRSELTSWVS